MSMIKGCLFFDIDGTLVDSERTGQVDEEVLEAIRTAKKNGYACLIASGRSLAGLSQYRDIGMDGYVFSDGAGILIEGKDMIIDPIPKEQVLKLIEQAKEYHAELFMSSLHTSFASEEQYQMMKEWETILSKDGKEADLGLHSLEELNDDPILESDICFKSPAEEQIWLAVKDPSLEYINTTASYGRNGGTSGELTHIGVTKGTGALLAAEMLGCDRAHTYAFGDSMNDASMLKECEYGIAMGNSAEELKEIADYITTDINDRGIKNALEYYGII